MINVKSSHFLFASHRPEKNVEKFYTFVKCVNVGVTQALNKYIFTIIFYSKERNVNNAHLRHHIKMLRCLQER